MQIELYQSEIEKFEIFNGMPLADIMQLLTGAKIKASKHREFLFKSGEEAHFFFIILRGAYKLVRPSVKGDDVIIYFSGPGDALAAFVMPMQQASYPVSAVSMGTSLVLQIPRRTYLDYWAKNAGINQRIQMLMYQRMSALQDDKIKQKSSLQTKIAHLLIQLCEKYSRETETILPIPLTRREIADSVGATVESVIRCMSEWSHSGIIQTSEQYIEILKPGALIEFMSST